MESSMPLAVLVLVQVVHEVRLGASYQRMPMSPVPKHLAQLVADEVDDGLEVELGGDALLDAVDDRELGGALLGLLQQALRLVEQARVLERDAHARGDGREQAHVGLAVRVLALVVLERDRRRARGRCRGWERDRPSWLWSVPGIVLTPRRCIPATLFTTMRLRASASTSAEWPRRSGSVGGDRSRSPCSYE